MADLSFLKNMDFDAVPEAREFTPVPKGVYHTIITATEDKQTSSGGQMVTFRFTIVDGDRAGDSIFENFNFVNSSEKAVAFAIQRYKSLCVTLGFSEFVSPTENLINYLVDLEMDVVMGKPYTKDGVSHPAKLENKLVKFLPSRTPGAQTAPVATPAAKSTLPWKK